MNAHAHIHSRCNPQPSFDRHQGSVFTHDRLKNVSSQSNQMCLFCKRTNSFLFFCIIHRMVHVHEVLKGQVTVRNSFICIYFWLWWKLCICTTDHDRSHREKCEMDLVTAQQLVQTWVMAFVYWKLSQRGGSHGPTDVSSTNASPVSVPFLLFTCHLALLKIVWPTALDLW